MKTGKKRVLLLAGLFASLFQLPFLQGSVDTTSADFLKITTGCRNAAMGEAGSAIGHDIESVANNAGNVSFLEGVNVMLEHAEWFGNVRYEALSVSLPLSQDVSRNSGTVFGHVHYLYVASFPIFDDWGKEIMADAAFHGMKASAGYSRTFVRSAYMDLGIGASASFIRKSVVDESSWSPSFDFGALAVLRHGNEGLGKLAGDFFNVTFSAHNVDLAFRKGTESLPVTFRMGIGFELFRMLNVGLDTPVFLDGSPFRGDFGLEYWFRDFVALRVGTRLGSGVISPLTAGVGVKQRAGFHALRFDYAVIPYAEGFGLTHRMSMKLELAPAETEAMRVKRAEFFYYQGVAAFIKGDYSKAEKFWLEALKKRPDYPDVMRRMAELKRLKELEEKYK
jgi:hypothetical protein